MLGPTATRPKATFSRQAEDLEPLIIRFDDPCTYFTVGKVKASTLSLTVLVIIEMLNAFNAVSEDGSLLQMAPWVNPWLVAACMGQGPRKPHIFA